MFKYCMATNRTSGLHVMPTEAERVAAFLTTSDVKYLRMCALTRYSPPRYLAPVSVVISARTITPARLEQRRSVGRGGILLAVKDGLQVSPQGR